MTPQDLEQQIAAIDSQIEALGRERQALKAKHFLMLIRDTGTAEGHGYMFDSIMGLLERGWITHDGKRYVVTIAGQEALQPIGAPTSLD